MKDKSKYISAIVVFFILIGGFIILKSIKPKEMEKPKQKPIPVVNVVTVSKESIPIFYTANGTTLAKISATLKPQVSGRVIKLFVEEGQRVKAGQTLAVIQPEKEDYQVESQLATINQLEQTYLNKKSIYERRKQLYEKELIAKEELDNAKTDMEVALNQLNAAKANLKEFIRQKNETVIKAPFDGILEKRFISIGDYVDSQTKMFYVIKLSPIWFTFDLPQVYIKNIKLGDSIDLEIDGIGKETGKVDYISSSLNENSLITVKAILNNNNETIKENMYGKAFVKLENVEGFKIPEQAVQLIGNDNFVYIVDQNKTKKILVKVVIQEPGYVYITGNLKEGDKVIISNLMNIKDGIEIKVVGDKR